jgi:hypothetical protein
VLSLPLWLYRVGMLVWALWLAASLVRAIGWGWRSFGEGGLWQRITIGRATPKDEAQPIHTEAEPSTSGSDEEDSPPTLD